MNNQELYDKVIEAYRSGDENLFNAAARNWVEGTENAPFDDPELNDLFDKAKRCCNAWRNKAINGRVSKIRMINCVRAIAEKNIQNPYNKKAEEQNIVITKENPKKEEKMYVLGVIPEELPENINAVDANGTIGGWTIEKTQEVSDEESLMKPTAETAPDKRAEGKEPKRIFNRRKKR